MNKRQLITTSDGSHSLYQIDLDETYHSRHGAIQEAYHVFIKNGLDFISKKKLSILEIGLGTGLNCLISLLESEKHDLTVDYTGIEAYPISLEEMSLLNYLDELKAPLFKKEFDLIHESEWEREIKITDNFSLVKRNQKFQEISDKNRYNLIFFDAFGARVQPELWTEEIFQKMYDALLPNGVLVTYAAKGSVRRAMLSVGFSIERLPGPPGKREMLRGIKSL